MSIPARWTVDRWAVAALGLLVLVMAADVWTTTAILASGGRELNPLMVPIAHQPAVFTAAKAAALGAVLPLVAVLARIRAWLAPGALALLAAGYVPILVHNVSQLRL